MDTLKEDVKMEKQYTIEYRTFSDATIKQVKANLLAYIAEKFQDGTYSRDHYNYIKWQVMKYTNVPAESLIIESIL
jgi:hypothetical protein